MKTLSWGAGIALLAAVVCVTSADAATVKCQRAIAKASAQFVQSKVKILSKCEASIVKGSIAGPCPDTKAADKIAKATTKLTTTIGKSCGGDDKECGGDLTNEDTPISLGWPSSCPNFEVGSCNNTITTCGDIATCLACVGEAAVDQAINLYYDELLLPSADQLNKCQASIGKATTAFLTSKTKALQKCTDGRLNGKGNICVPLTSPNDDKTIAAISKAEDKKVTTICKACGGADQVCGGGDDLTPVVIGFPTACPLVTIPGGAACGGPITDLQSLVDCVDCVTEYKADCVSQLQAPQFGAYPAECNLCPAQIPTGPCPATINFTADGQKVDLDTGWTGLAHNAQVPTNGRITLTLKVCAGGTNDGTPCTADTECTGGGTCTSTCAGGSQPTCGQCDVNGPLDNAGGDTFSNHRCQDQPWVQCSDDADCTSATACSGGTNSGAPCTAASECPSGACLNAGATGPCIFFFGAPLPLVAGGVSTCIVNEISGPVTGTINIDDGSSVTVVPLASKVHPTGGEFSPCPHCAPTQCVGGTNDGDPCNVTADCPGGGACVDTGNYRCTDGPRLAKACSVTGESLQYGDVSLDCPPNPGANVGTLTINLRIATGNQSVTLAASNPTCRQTGYTGLKCFCDSCNNLNQEACSSDLDCPISGGNPGICGGRRCIGGTNAGAPCSVVSECPGGGQCNRPGQATQPNACLGVGNVCQSIGDNEGSCPLGPVDSFCSIQRQHPCTLNSDCDPSPACEQCVSGQTCIAKNRSCFTDNGVIGNSISVTGEASAPCGGVSRPTVGTFFCVAPVGASAVNTAGGLPGFGRIRIPGVVVVDP